MTVSSTNPELNFIIQHGSGSVYVQAVTPPLNTSTTVVLTFDNGKVVYKIPYTTSGPA